MAKALQAAPVITHAWVCDVYTLKPSSTSLHVSKYGAFIFIHMSTEPPEMISILRLVFFPLCTLEL